MFCAVFIITRINVDCVRLLDLLILLWIKKSAQRDAKPARWL